MTTDPFKDAAARAAAELSRPAPPPTVDEAMAAINGVLASDGDSLTEVSRKMATMVAVEEALTAEDYETVLGLVEQQVAARGG